MRLDTGLFQQQTQKQILSPQMIQSMEILVLNQQQLEERINEELESNVALEREEGESAEDGEGGKDSAQDRATDTPADAVDGDGEPREDAGELRDLEELRDLGERYAQPHELQKSAFWAESSPGRKSSLAGGDEEYEWVDHVEGPSESLADNLLAQLRMNSILSDRQRALCEEIIFNLDERGWQLHSLAEISKAIGDGIHAADSDPRLGEITPSDAEWQDALHMVQRLDPAGVGAEDLVDCLCLQLQRDPGENQFEELLVRLHLDDLAKNRLPHIAKSTGRSLEAVKNAVEVIRSLEPNPGRHFVQTVNPRIVPDILIERDSNGAFKVEAGGQATPRLRISPHYRELLQGATKDPELSNYLRKHSENAGWLVGSVEHRSSTCQSGAADTVQRRH